jgi:hypothetical protein
VVEATRDLERTVEAARVALEEQSSPHEVHAMVVRDEEKVLDALRVFLIEAKSAAS